MVRLVIALVWVVGCQIPWATAQTVRTNTAPANSGPRLGLYCTKVPEPLYVHLCAFAPNLQKGTGLLIRQVQVDSPGDQIGLKRHDILLSCNGKPVTSIDQLASLVRNPRANHKGLFVLLRGGKEMTLDVNLARIKVVALESASPDNRGKLKKGRPAEVTVKATTIGNGQLEITFEYYPDGKCKQVTYTGTLDEIEGHVKNLPGPVQDYARVALSRLRTRKQ
jgi:hypothetical protein